MAQKDCIPYGSDTSAGRYKCSDCGYEMSHSSNSSLPPCPKHDEKHTQNCWMAMSGQGDAMDDPQR
jgi:transposase-like protein